MTKWYQVMNFQHQPVKVCKSLILAQEHIKNLIETYKDEGFYIVELTVMYESGKIDD